MKNFASTLNRRITIQQRGTGEDALGQPTKAWIDVIELWANVLNENGAQSIKANAEINSVKTSFRIRYRTNVLPTMRVVFSGLVYDIKAVLPDEQSRVYVDLSCEVVK